MKFGVLQFFSWPQRRVPLLDRLRAGSAAHRHHG